MEGHREGWSASHVSKPGPVVTTKTRARATTGIHSKGIRDSLWMRAGQEHLGLWLTATISACYSSSQSALLTVCRKQKIILSYIRQNSWKAVLWDNGPASHMSMHSQQRKKGCISGLALSKFYLKRTDNIHSKAPLADSKLKNLVLGEDDMCVWNTLRKHETKVENNGHWINSEGIWWCHLVVASVCRLCSLVHVHIRTSVREELHRRKNETRLWWLALRRDQCLEMMSQ